MKNFLYSAMAILTLASCTSDEFMGDESIREANNNAPISFGFDVSAATRANATGSDAAAHLGNQFIVYGEKNENTDGTAPSDGHLVFPNYQVNYSDNTAYTTTSNTKNWEYVGTNHSSEYASNIFLGDAAVTTNLQTVKYWDYSASNYVFTAVSAKQDDITNGRVKIKKLTSGSGKGYEITLAKDASNNYPSLASLYFADRNVINHSTETNREANNAYGGNVTFTFRNALSQIRVGMYETIPGYDVTGISFYVTNDSEAKDASSNSAFGAIVPNVKADAFTGKIKVTYYDNSTSVENQPNLEITADANLQKNDLILGTKINTISTASPMATSASAPTWDTNNGTFTSVLPQTTNTSKLTLKVNYTLYNSVTHETIQIENKTAEVPAEYLKWKPNYKYTYLFKISDNDLYPITFDAVEIVAEDGQAEYITTVSEPSITTFGVSGGKYVTGGNDYAVGSDIYAVIVDGTGAVVNPQWKTNTHLYKVSSSDSNYEITEASVAEAIEHPTGNKLTCTHICTSWESASKATQVSSVPSEDGTTISVNAVKFTPATGDAGYYAIQYIGGTGTTYVEVEGLTAGTSSVTGLYTKSGDSYTKIEDENAKAEVGTTYYKSVTGTPSYKVIRVQ